MAEQETRLIIPHDKAEGIFRACNRLKQDSDFQVLIEILEGSNDYINDRLRSRNDDREFFRDQGAGGIIDEILKLFEDPYGQANKIKALNDSKKNPQSKNF